MLSAGGALLSECSLYLVNARLPLLLSQSIPRRTTCFTDNLFELFFVFVRVPL